MSSEPSTSTGSCNARVPPRNEDNKPSEQVKETEGEKGKTSDKTTPSDAKKPEGVDPSKKDALTKRIRKDLLADDKKSQALAQKKAFDDRFKKRGKRPLPPREEGEDDSAKKPKRELSAYEKEVQKYESRILKDQGSGVRSVMK